MELTNTTHPDQLPGPCLETRSSPPSHTATSSSPLGFSLGTLSALGSTTARLEYDSFELPSTSCSLLDPSPPSEERERLVMETTVGADTLSSTVSELLAVISEDGLDSLFAQDIFATFMWAVAYEMASLPGNPTLLSSDTGWRSFQLEHTLLSRLAKDIEDVTTTSKLGSLETVYLSILPPLIHHGKLPAPLSILEHAKSVAQPYEQVGRWKESADIYRWLFRTCNGPKLPRQLRVRATAVLYEFFEMVKKQTKDYQDQKVELKDLTEIGRITSSLREELETRADKEIFKSLVRLRTIQRSSLEILGFDFKGFAGHSASHESAIYDWSFQGGDFPPSMHALYKTDLLGLSPVHYAAIVGNTVAVLHLPNYGVDTADCLGWTPLHYATLHDATENDHLTKLQRQLAQTQENHATTAQDLSGRTPLHFAKEESIAWMLLKEGARIDIRARDGTGALHSAAAKGLLEIVKLYLDAGANIDIPDNTRKTPLHWASFHGHAEVVNLLVKKGANRTARDETGRIPLSLAAVSGTLTKEMSKYLNAREDVTSSDRRGLTSLHLASLAGKDTAVSILHELDAELEARDRSQNTPLHLAASAGHAATVRLLIDYGADIDAKANKYGNFFMVAVAAGQELVVRLAVNLGVDINAQGAEAFQLAIRRGNEGMVRLLIELGVEMGTNQGDALHLATSERKGSIVRALVELKADTEARDSEGLTALQAAGWADHADMVQVLIDCGANVNASGGPYGTALQAAIRRGGGAVSRLLLERGADVHVNIMAGEYGTALTAAAREGNEDQIRTLIEKGANVNAWAGQYGTALQAAAVSRNLDTVRLLLQLGADANDRGGLYGTTLRAEAAKGENEDLVQHLSTGASAPAVFPGLRPFGTSLQAASWWGNTDVVRLLIENGADVNAPGGKQGPILQTAAYRQHIDIVQLLIDSGSDLNAQGGEYGTALQAVLAGLGWEDNNAEAMTIAKLLIENGADADARCGHYGTALQAAAYKRQTHIAKLLLDSGADVNAQGGEYSTALQAAALFEGDMVALLVENGANVNAQSGEYGGALHVAAFWGHKEMVLFLLDSGADINAQGDEYGTPLQAVAFRSRPDMVRLLLDRGADVNAPGGKYGTALHAAKNCEDSWTPSDIEATIQVLLDHGAKPDLGSDNGEGRAETDSAV